MSSLREQLQAIYEAEGTLTPSAVVAAATPESSPLHPRLEWDNQVAGHQYRLVQARQLIRSCTVVYRTTENGGEERVRAFVAAYRQGDPDSAGYMPTEEALSDEFCAGLVLRQFEREVAALRRSYGHLLEFEEIVRRQLLGEQESA